jgi:hypothetical protein
MTQLRQAAFVWYAGLCIAAQIADAQTPQAGTARTEGIWKAAVPQNSMHGEFDNFDPLGVAAGARIKADCSLNWIDPDDGKLYCFASGTSLEFFLDQPHAAIARARRAWQKLSAS